MVNKKVMKLSPDESYRLFVCHIAEWIRQSADESDSAEVAEAFNQLADIMETEIITPAQRTH
jgi:hypothetical protein